MTTIETPNADKLPHTQLRVAVLDTLMDREPSERTREAALRRLWREDAEEVSATHDELRLDDAATHLARRSLEPGAVVGMD